tara:strand:- start:1028 stop:1144 length:117 start_codon:yes stop_codon:yes gene_type:complete
MGVLPKRVRPAKMQVQNSIIENRHDYQDSKKERKEKSD